MTKYKRMLLRGLLFSVIAVMPITGFCGECGGCGNAKCIAPEEVTKPVEPEKTLPTADNDDKSELAFGVWIGRRGYRHRYARPYYRPYYRYHYGPRYRGYYRW